MNDLISRQAAIDEIERNAYRHTYLDQIVGIIYDLPSLSKWIPVSERLPEVRHNVLITDGHHVAEGQLMDSGDWMQYRWTVKRKHEEIIAWQPLPKPYKGEEE